MATLIEDIPSPDDDVHYISDDQDEMALDNLVQEIIDGSKAPKPILLDPGNWKLLNRSYSEYSATLFWEIHGNTEDPTAVTIECQPDSIGSSSGTFLPGSQNESNLLNRLRIDGSGDQVIISEADRNYAKDGITRLINCVIENTTRLGTGEAGLPSVKIERSSIFLSGKNASIHFGTYEGNVFSNRKMISGLNECVVRAGTVSFMTYFQDKTNQDIFVSNSLLSLNKDDLNSTDTTNPPRVHNSLFKEEMAFGSGLPETDIGNYSHTIGYFDQPIQLKSQVNKPDLQIELIETKPDPMKADEPAEVSLTVKNTGSKAGSRAFGVVSSSGEIQETFEFELEAGEENTITKTVVPPSSSTQIIVGDQILPLEIDVDEGDYTIKNVSDDVVYFDAISVDAGHKIVILQEFFNRYQNTIGKLEERDEIEVAELDDTGTAT